MGMKPGDKPAWAWEGFQKMGDEIWLVGVPKNDKPQ